LPLQTFSFPGHEFKQFIDQTLMICSVLAVRRAITIKQHALDLVLQSTIFLLFLVNGCSHLLFCRDLDTSIAYCFVDEVALPEESLSFNAMPGESSGQSLSFRKAENVVCLL